MSRKGREASMQSGRGVSSLPVILLLMALPFLVGSSCFFAFSSGGGSGGAIIKDDDDDDDDDEEEETGFVQTGSLSAPAAAGVNYDSGSLSGVTGANGAFEYIEGETVQFFIGEIALGAAVPGQPSITPADLAAGNADDATAAVNIARLLHSLDANLDDDVVTIPAGVRAAAVSSNTAIASAIEFLDFSDEAAFTNAASQLVSSLTGDYPRTATLVDAQDVEASKPASPGRDREP